MKLISKMAVAAAVLAVASAVLAVAPGVSAQTSKAINPTTGKDCVQEAGARDEGDNHVRFIYRNTCGSSFSISIYVDNQSRYGGYIQPYSDREFVVKRSEAMGNMEWSYE